MKLKRDLAGLVHYRYRNVIDDDTIMREDAITFYKKRDKEKTRQTQSPPNSTNYPCFSSHIPL